MIHHRVFLTNAVGRDAGSQNCFVILTTTIYARSLYLEHGLIIVTASSEQRMKKKIQARPERADFNSSFIRFVRCCKTSRRWKKKSLCCSFQASKKTFLAILNGWTLQRDQVCVKKCVTRNEKWNSQHSIYWPGNK